MLVLLVQPSKLFNIVLVVVQIENKLLSARQTGTKYTQGPEGSTSGRQAGFEMMRCFIFYITESTTDISNVIT